MEGLGQRVSVDHVEERRRVVDRLPGRCGRSGGRARGRSRYAASSARSSRRSTSGRPALCVRRPSPGRRDDGGEVVVLDHEAEPTRPQLDARPRRPLVGPDRPGEDVDHAEIALDRGRRRRVDLRHRDGWARDPPASPARPGPHRATARRPRRSAGTSPTARRRGPRRPGGPARRRAGTRPGGAPPPSCRYRAPLGRPSRRRGGDGSRRPARPGSWPPRPACDRSAARRAPPAAHPRPRGTARPRPRR